MVPVRKRPAPPRATDYYLFIYRTVKKAGSNWVTAGATFDGPSHRRLQHYQERKWSIHAPAKPFPETATGFRLCVPAEPGLTVQLALNGFLSAPHRKQRGNPVHRNQCREVASLARGASQRAAPSTLEATLSSPRSQVDHTPSHFITRRWQSPLRPYQPCWTRLYPVISPDILPIN